jgi:hypothetical protein
MGVGTPEIREFRFFARLGWRWRLAPFFFYPVRVTKTLLGLRYFNERPGLSAAALLGAFSGAGAGLSGLLSLRRRLASFLSTCQISEESVFGDWADRIFTDALPEYAYFGDLKVGTLADGFGRVADAPALVAAGINYLAETGVDIIVANFLHSAWAQACRRSGMIAGPSNYHIFVSPGGSLLGEDSCPPEGIHVARGHGDGLFSLV